MDIDAAFSIETLIETSKFDSIIPNFKNTANGNRML